MLKLDTCTNPHARDPKKIHHKGRAGSFEHARTPEWLTRRFDTSTFDTYARTWPNGHDTSRIGQIHP